MYNSMLYQKQEIKLLRGGEKVAKTNFKIKDIKER